MLWVTTCKTIRTSLGALEFSQNPVPNYLIILDLYVNINLTTFRQLSITLIQLTSPTEPQSRVAGSASISIFLWKVIFHFPYNELRMLR